MKRMTEETLQRWAKNSVHQDMVREAKRARGAEERFAKLLAQYVQHDAHCDSAGGMSVSSLYQESVEALKGTLWEGK